MVDVVAIERDTVVAWTSGERVAEMDVVEQPNQRESLARLVIVFGLFGSVVGVGLTARAALEAHASARTQAGPDVPAVVVATGAVGSGHQQATLQYEDSDGVGHQIDVELPLGRAESILPGTGTGVTYDRSSPDSAELIGAPGARWHDVGRSFGLTSLATGAWLVLALFIRNGRPVVSTGPDEGAPVPFDPTGLAESRARQNRLLMGLAAGLLGIGQLTYTVATRTYPVSAAFPPIPPDVADERRDVALPAALTAPVSGPRLVTLAEAEAVFEAMWPLRDEALALRDADVVRAIQTGPALEVDLARMRYGHPPNRGGASVGGLDDFKVFVPSQYEWPIYFMAQALTTSADHPFLEVMIFVRASPSSPWKVAFDTGISAGNGYTPRLMAAFIDGEGYNVVPEVNWTDPTAVAGALGGYWQSWVEHGHPSTGPIRFAEGFWTNGYGAEIAHRQGQRRENGLIGYDERGFVPSPDEIWTFGINDKQVACFPLRERLTWMGAHQDGQRRKWGPDLEPGNYRSVTAEKVRQLCTSIPTRPGPVGVWGADAPTVSLSGEAG